MTERLHPQHLESLHLREVEPGDLPTLFQQQLDPEANHMAGTKPRSAESFRATWDRIFKDPTVVARAIISDGRIVGSISCFKHDGRDAVGYWIAREHWGRGFATRALRLLLRQVPQRPLHATAAKTNAASIHILETCGFRLTGYHMGEDTDRFVGREVASFVLE